MSYVWLSLPLWNNYKPEFSCQLEKDLDRLNKYVRAYRCLKG